MTRLVWALLALLLLGTLPGTGRADGAGWNPPLVRALVRLEQLPSGSCRATWQALDGSRSKGWVRWGAALPSHDCQTRLDLWQAAAPGRHLPRLGGPVRVLNRYDTGKPLAGTFLGFDGPLLVLGGAGRVPERHLEWDGLQVVDEAGRALTGVESLRGWPPSRRPLVLTGSSGERVVWPDEVAGLELREWSAGDTAFVAFLAVLAFGVYGLARALGEAMGMAVMPSD
jgi:hypothetical protein